MTSTTSLGLAGTIGQRVSRCVGPRVQGLIVVCRDDAIVVRGRATSYHAWQLVIAECQKTLAGAEALRLDCVLHVSPLR